MMGWLQQSVPLWVFLIALLTNPARWSKWARETMDSRLGGTA